MIIKEHKLVPDYYVEKIPVCDTCLLELELTNKSLASYPPKSVYKCPQCDKEYYIESYKLQGEWKWKKNK